MRRQLAGVAIFLTLAAAVCWCAYSPLYTDDGAYYLLLARAIRQGTFFSQDNGGRTPLFPLYVAILGSNSQAVFTCNLVLAVLTALLLFRLFALLTDSRAVATAAAVIYILNPSTIYFERAVLTEILSAFWIALGAFLTASACRSPVGLARHTFLISTAFSLAALTRPVFQLLPLVALAAILALTRQRPPRRGGAYKAVGAGLIPFAALVMGWALLNYERFGWFTLSTLEGYNLTNHTGQFMNESPPQYARIAGIYIRYERAHLRKTGMRANTIWEAKHEMMQAAGMNDAQLSRLLVGLSLRLMISHPAGYFESVGRAFKRFWRPPVYARGCNVGDFLAGLREVRAGRATWFERFYAYLYLPLVLAYAFSLGGPLILKDWRRVLWTPAIWVVHSVILYTAVSSSLAEYGDNNRYKFPVEGLVIGMAPVVCYMILNRSHERGAVHGCVPLSS